MLALKSRGNYPIDGEVDVDETVIGGKVKEILFIIIEE
jgi:hypothetical protein